MKTPNISLHSVLKNSYSSKKAKNMQGYQLDNELSDHNQSVYYNPEKRKLLFSVTGSHNLSDVGTDLYLAAGHLKDTNRYKKAHQGLRDAKAKYGVNNAIVTGHSLGGSIAGYIASNDDHVITLDKGATFGQKIKKNENAYRTKGDIVSVLNTYTPGMTTLKNPKKENEISKMYQAVSFGQVAARAKEALEAHDVDNIKDSNIEIASNQGEDDN